MSFLSLSPFDGSSARTESRPPCLADCASHPVHRSLPRHLHQQLEESALRVVHGPHTHKHCALGVGSSSRRAGKTGTVLWQRKQIPEHCGDLPTVMRPAESGGHTRAAPF